MENQTLNNGILKSNSRLARAKQFMVAAFVSAVLAIVSLGASAGLVIGMRSSEKNMDNIVHEFVETREYKDEYNKTYQELKGSKNFFEEVVELRSYNHAVEMLESSNNEELKEQYIKNKEKSNQFSKAGLATAVTAGVCAAAASVFIGLSDSEKNKKKKEENEGLERSMA